MFSIINRQNSPRNLSCIDKELFNKVTPEQAEVISGGGTVLERGIDFSGNDLYQVTNSTLPSCRSTVDNDPSAIAGTYRISTRDCYVKRAITVKTPREDAIGIRDVS